jgi:uncharacterized protein
MTTDLTAKLAFLRSPGVLDHIAEAIETHMAWVFLGERRAWKLRKPVRLPYLDHSTVEQRRRSSFQEVQLGRRLAASVYLDIVPLVVGPSGFALGGAGEIVDWLVVMRRLPGERMLPQMVARGAAMPADADALGDLLAAFYRRAVRAPWDGAEYRHRLRNAAVTVAGELVERGASRAQLGAIVHAQLAAIEHEARTLDARVADGRVVDAHGDLRPEHVCLEAPPVVIDPLEFDDELRLLDAASELAFFALECERLGAAWFGDRVLARYAGRSGDRVPAPVTVLYRVQHALTRALIALRHIEGVLPDDQPRWRKKADGYLAQAGTRSSAGRSGGSGGSE